MQADLFLQMLQQGLRHPRYIIGLLRKKINLHRRYRWILQHAGEAGCVPLPLIYKLELTHACNLRCKMCFQWGQEGWCRKEKMHDRSGELDLDIIESLFAQVGKTRPDVILIGGEPLLYSHFESLSALLKKYQCNTTICTNGLELNRHEDVIAKNPFLAFVVSLDGLQETNDFIRGAGVYKKVTENIRALKKLTRPPYIGIQFTIRPENVGQMHAFCQEMGKLGADWVLLNLFWFITEKEAGAYQDVIRQSYGIIPSKHLGFRMPYPIDRRLFIEQYRKIQNGHFPMQVSCYLKKPEDMHAYIDDSAGLVSTRRCYKQWIRADITPSGDVSPCIQFPDLVFGNLGDATIKEIWNNSQFKQFRERACRMNLPLCGKCNNIYLYDAGRKYL
jgi:radical SAM protein with 4Fe4S-binding SPASM domain